jgi:hypothetical protein|tara:strand:- start:313 stop:717 length:405 start_codon:yes stop_codon:yes gene_type:complete
MKPFDYVTSVSYSKKNLMRGSENDELAESGYQPYLTNKALSYFPDSLFYSNEMNMNHHADNILQYEYLINTLRPKRRFAKWVKAEDNDDLEAIKLFFGYSNKKAEQTLSILSSEQIKIIKDELVRGREHEYRVS